MILANVWMSNVRFENLWIRSFQQYFCSTILKFRGLFRFVFPSRRLSVSWYLNWFKNEISLTLEANSEVYWEPCQTSKLEVFRKIFFFEIIVLVWERRHHMISIISPCCMKCISAIQINHLFNRFLTECLWIWHWCFFKNYV